jgi:hypothetical protein
MPLILIAPREVNVFERLLEEALPDGLKTVMLRREPLIQSFQRRAMAYIVLDNYIAKRPHLIEAGAKPIFNTANNPYSVGTMNNLAGF